MFSILLNLLSIAGIFFLIFGMYMFFVPMIKIKSPMDNSNIWNGLIAVIYVAFRPHIFGGIKFFQNDIGKNIRLVEKAVKDENNS